MHVKHILFNMKHIVGIETGLLFFMLAWITVVLILMFLMVFHIFFKNSKGKHSSIKKETFFKNHLIRRTTNNNRKICILVPAILFIGGPSIYIFLFFCRMRYILSFSQVCCKTQMGYCHCIIKCNVCFFKHAIIGREKLILRYYQWEFHRTIHYLTIIWKEYLLLKAASKTIKWITLCSIFF